MAWALSAEELLAGKKRCCDNCVIQSTGASALAGRSSSTAETGLKALSMLIVCGRSMGIMFSSSSLVYLLQIINTVQGL